MRRLLRLHHWWAGKVPPALAVGYLVLSRQAAPLDPVDALRVVALFLMTCLGIGGLGYLLNDAFDVEEDRRNGKSNFWASLSAPARVYLVALLLAAAWLPWWWLPGAEVALPLVAVEMLLFVAYSVPPIRLKERGLAGIVTDALYAHVIPMLVAWVAFSPPSLRGRDVATPSILALWMLLMGMRHLARHQHDDLDRDRFAGLRTFAVRRGRDRTMAFIVRRVLPLEGLAALLALIWLASAAPLLVAGFTAHTLWELYVVRRRWLAPMPPFAAMTDTERHDLYGQRILSAYVERWFAPLALATLVLHDPRSLWLVPLHLIAVGSPLRSWWRDARALPRFAGRSS